MKKSKSLIKIICILLVFAIAIPVAAFAISNIDTTDYNTYEIDSDDYTIDIKVSEQVNTNVPVTFGAYIVGTNGAYSKAQFKAINDLGLEVIDDGLPENTWCNVTGQFKVLTNNTDRYVRVHVVGANGKTIYITKSVDMNKTDAINGDLFGGATVYMLPTQKLGEQNHSFVIVTNAGSVIVHDGGLWHDAEYLLDFISTKSWAKTDVTTGKPLVDYWFISHYHGDHIGALGLLLKEEKVVINNLVYDFLPDATIMGHTEDPASDGYKWTRDYKGNGCVKNEITNLTKNQEITIDEIKFTVLNPSIEFSHNFGNNTSVVYRMDTAGESVLWLGDAGVELGQWLIDNNLDGFTGDNACKVLQAAHHGQNGTNQTFYNTAGSKIWLIPTCTSVWYDYDATGKSDYYKGGYATELTRSWMREMGVIRYYVGIESSFVTVR